MGGKSNFWFARINMKNPKNKKQKRDFWFQCDGNGGYYLFRGKNGGHFSRYNIHEDTEARDGQTDEKLIILDLERQTPGSSEWPNVKRLQFHDENEDAIIDMLRSWVDSISEKSSANRLNRKGLRRYYADRWYLGMDTQPVQVGLRRPRDESSPQRNGRRSKSKRNSIRRRPKS